MLFEYYITIFQVVMWGFCFVLCLWGVFLIKNIVQISKVSEGPEVEQIIKELKEIISDE